MAKVPVEGGNGRAVVSPTASTLRDEMAVSGQPAGRQRADSMGRRNRASHPDQAPPNPLLLPTDAMTGVNTTWHATVGPQIVEIHIPATAARDLNGERTEAAKRLVLRPVGRHRSRS
jgi:hypothetical protein